MPVAAPVRDLSQDIVRFLLHRVEDDEAELKRLVRRHADPGSGISSIERLQAEAAAKRRLIGCVQQLLVLRDQPAEKAVRDQASQMLRTLALPYHDHPGYRREWRPSGSH